MAMAGLIRGDRIHYYRCSCRQGRSKGFRVLKPTSNELLNAVAAKLNLIIDD